MHPAEVSKLLERFKYKPNFKFYLVKENDYQLHITMDVPYVDDDRNGEIGPVGYSMDFSWIQTPGGFFNVLFNHIISMEMHEAKEHFIVDEQPFFPPHPVLKEAA